jgi:glycosyltransferase involved in cell wall biosynthesis
MYRVIFFYRSPNPIYFSIEKLFKGVYLKISRDPAAGFMVKEYFLPLPSKLKNILANISFARRRQADINHITGDIHYIILGCSNKALNVLTIHDCVMLHHYSKWDPRYWALKWIWYDLPVRKADAVTVISEQTRKELIHFTGCDSRKISVIPDYVDPAFMAFPREFQGNRPLILFIGTTPNKNLERLIAALEGLGAELDIVGFLTDSQKELLENRHIWYRQSSGLTQAELLQKYIQCEVVAFPSTYEGFGLPILEGQAVGRPVLTSRLSPMQEVAGGGACLVDPYDILSIREGLLNIINNREFREKAIAAGFENVKRFQLDKIADQYSSLYRDLLRQKELRQKS